jgi:hypothetical protein
VDARPETEDIGEIRRLIGARMKVRAYGSEKTTETGKREVQ